MKIQDVNPSTLTPLCPHCEAPLDSIYRLQDDKGSFQTKLGYCYVCPHCRKVLGFSDYAM
jgi:hypothetical protein